GLNSQDKKPWRQRAALETEGSPGDRGQPWRQRAALETEGSPGDRGQPWRQRAALETEGSPVGLIYSGETQ
ncbi:hypothetical protein NQZ68_026035, partial [Dissostichus eleginoides]